MPASESSDGTSSADEEGTRTMSAIAIRTGRRIRNLTPFNLF